MAVDCTLSPILKLDYLLVEHFLLATELATEPIVELAALLNNNSRI